ncbi:hypothetical protein BGZ94_001457 [Podila epigama]|nr:hypothetical protein BGZ94_001457 [Podila epigama]
MKAAPAVVLLAALIGTGFSTPIVYDTSAQRYTQPNRNIIAAPRVKATQSNTFNATASSKPVAFFEPLRGSLDNFKIKHDSGPDRWSCAYRKEEVIPTAKGTSLAIGRRSPRKPYSCSEIIYQGQRANYGVYSLDIIPTNIRGHVTGFFLMVKDVSEIDVEFTGLNSTVVWLNVWEGRTQSPKKIPLGFDATKAWHTYQIEWRKDFIAWSVDGMEILRRTNVYTVDPNEQEYKLSINSWTQAANETTWAGTFQWPGKAIESQFRNLRYHP